MSYKLLRLLVVATVLSACSEPGGESINDPLILTDAIARLCHPSNCDNIGRPAVISEIEAMDSIVDGMDSCGDIQTHLETLMPKSWIITDSVAQDSAGGAFLVWNSGATRLFVSERYWTNQYPPHEFNDRLFELLRHEGAHASDFWGTHGGSVQDWRSVPPEEYHGTSFTQYWENCSQT